MRIDRNLNIVIPVETDTGLVHVHSMPISTDAFHRYHLIIAKTFARIYNQGLGALAGPRVAALLLRETAKDLAPVGAGAQAAEVAAREADGLLAEIRRLSNVSMPTPRGWETIPCEEARNRGVISADDWEDVENILVFFIVACAMQRGEELETARQMTAALLGVEYTSLNCTGFTASLRTSTETDSSSAKPTPSSIPS